MPFMIEVIVDLTVITNELLERCDGFKALHGALLSPNREVRVFTATIRSSTTQLTVRNANFVKGCTV